MRRRGYFRHDRAVITAEQRRWVLLNALLATAVINTAVNLGIGLFEARGQRHVPTWGISAAHPSVTSDAMGVLITLPLITCLLVSAAVRREQAEQRLTLLDPVALGRLSRFAVPGAGKRAIRFAVASFAVLAPPVVLATALSAAHGMSHGAFVTFHVALTVVLGAIVTPMIALAAMTEPAPHAAAGLEAAK